MIFTTVFSGCFHFWLHLFMSPTFFTMTALLLLFYQVLYFCVVVRQVLRIWESIFTLCRFLPSTPSQHLPHYQEYYGFQSASLPFLRIFTIFVLHSFPTPSEPLLIKASSGAGSFSLKVARPPTKVGKLDPFYLFVWITQCSGKLITR